VTNPQRFCEIWNNVFMQYDQQEDGTYLPLAQQSVDTGLGLERVAALLQGVETPYETDLFLPLIAASRSIATQSNSFAERVVADHVRAATFILAEGVRPGNVAQGYVVRRLIRRAVRYGRELGMQGAFLVKLSAVVIEQMGEIYPHLATMNQQIAMVLEDEELRFQRTIARGEKFFHQTADRTLSQGETMLAGTQAFHLYETYGFPLELTEEYAKQRGLVVDHAGFQHAFEAHQQRSRKGAKGRFAN
jgi:alanyl-tRNA synthetase